MQEWLATTMHRKRVWVVHLVRHPEWLCLPTHPHSASQEVPHSEATHALRDHAEDGETYPQSALSVPGQIVGHSLLMSLLCGGGRRHIDGAHSNQGNSAHAGVHEMITTAAAQ